MTQQTEPFNAAYGGEGWSPRTMSLREELGQVWAVCGVSTEWEPLKAVLLHRPGAEIQVGMQNPNAVQMLAPIDLALAQQEHDAMAQAYEQAGVIVTYIHPAGEPEGDIHPNQMFVADLMFMTPEGVILARPASTIRAGEERCVAHRLASMGIPILRIVRGTGTFEGADATWLDPQTVLLGQGLRTNAEGAAQVTGILQEMGVQVIQVDLPVGTMHLMGMVRLVDRDLAIVWPKRLAYTAVEALKERGFQIAFIPDEVEAATNSALNFVTLGPRQILMPAGNANTQAFLENLGIICHRVDVTELRKAAGAIGCLTGIVHRESL